MCLSPHPDIVNVSYLLSHAMPFLQLVCQLEPLGDSIGNKWILTCICQEGDRTGFYFCKWRSCFVTSFFSFKNLGSGFSWAYSELLTSRSNFHDILHCIGCFPPGGFILIQQCRDFALYMRSIGEPVSCTLHLLCFCGHLNLRHSAFQGGNLANFLELKCIDVCLVHLQVDAKWSLWLASILLNSGNKV